MFQEHGENWYGAVPLMEFAHNNSFQESIGCSPFRADLGIQPGTPSLVEAVHQDENFNLDVEEFVEAMEAIRVRTRDAIVEAQRKQELNANKNRKS